MSGKRERVRLFPLAGAILFPRTQLPLHIFEPRYRAMVADALASDRRIAMIQPSEGGDPPPLFRVGCLGAIAGVEEMEDGRFNIILDGLERFRLIAEADVGTDYRQADVELGIYDDGHPDPLPIAHRAAIEREARAFSDMLGLSVDWTAVSRLDDELLVNVIAQVAPFDEGAKQALLEAETLAARADLAVQLMRFQRLALGGASDAPRGTLQ